MLQSQISDGDDLCEVGEIVKMTYQGIVLENIEKVAADVKNLFDASLSFEGTKSTIFEGWSPIVLQMTVSNSRETMAKFLTFRKLLRSMDSTPISKDLVRIPETKCSL